MIQLKEVQQRLDYHSVVKSTRELLKEGKIKTVAPSTGNKLSRYVFLVRHSLSLRFI